MKKLLTFLLLPIFFLQTAYATTITQVSPSPLTPGGTLTIQGNDFGTGTGSLLLNGVTLPATSWGNTSISATVPTNATSGTLELTTGTGTGATFSVDVSTGTGNVITNIEPSSFKPGDIVSLQGSGFGTTPPSQKQLCFSEDLCTTEESFAQIITSWTNTEVRFQVPDWNLPTSGQVHILVNKQGTPGFVGSPDYSFTPTSPVIDAVSPSTLTFSSTVLTITGSGFGEAYTPGKSQVCIENGCILDNRIQDFLVSWSDTEIRTKVPFVENSGSIKLSLVLYRFTEVVSGEDVFVQLESGPLSISQTSDPVISSLSATSIVPGVTILSINGSGFGDNFDVHEHQICFALDGCVHPTQIEEHLKLWSDTKIQVLIPSFVSNYQTVKVILRLYTPSTGGYTLYESPSTLQIQRRPFISLYYPKMETGAEYSIQGTDFGTAVGKVQVGTKDMTVTTWSPQKITFTVTDNTISGNLKVITANNTPSQGIPVEITQVLRFSKDPLSPKQWYFETINMKDAWTLTEGNSDIVVAVIDSGVDFSHEDLRDSSWINADELPGNGVDDDNNGFVDDTHGWNFINDSNSKTPQSDHGTTVASIIAAKKDNNLGIAGVAPKVKIMSLNVSSPPTAGVSENHIPYYAVEKAVKYAVDNGAHIINMSFGADGQDGLYREILEYAYQNNVLVVASSGNNNDNLDVKNFSPVCDDDDLNIVLGVTATNKGNKKAGFANYGRDCVDIAAPGVGIMGAYYSSSALLPGQIPYAISEGTSFSAPIVSGAAALLKSLHPDWNVEELKTALIRNTIPIENINPEYPNQLGTGLIDIHKLLLSSKPTVTYSASPTSDYQFIEKQHTSVIEVPKVQPIEEEAPTEVQDPADAWIDESTSTPDSIEQVFPDVVPEHQNAAAISYLKQKSILEGYPDGTFKPTNPVNRAEFLKILFEAQGITIPEAFNNCFPDVANEWFAKYVCFAKAKGIVEGYPEEGVPSTSWKFRPDQTINKVEAVKVLLSVFGETLQTGATTFNDVDNNQWFTPFIVTAEKLNLLEEEGKLVYQPGADMLRGGISELVYRLLYIKEKNLSIFTK